MHKHEWKLVKAKETSSGIEVVLVCSACGAFKTYSNTQEKSLSLETLIEECGKCSNEKGWKVTWEQYPAYILAAIDELSDSFDSGWRNDDKAKAFEEIGDCLIRLFHIIHDLDIPIMEILVRLMEENKHRPYLHGRVRM